MLQFIIPAVRVADDVFDLVKALEKSPIKENKPIVSVTRNETTKKLDKIEIAQDVSNELQTAISTAVRTKKTNSTTKEVDTVSAVQIAELQNTGELLVSAKDKNLLIQEQNAILRRMTEQMEIANGFRQAKYYSDLDQSASLLQSLENVGREIKIFRELTEQIGVKSSDNMEKYFSAMGTFYKFKTTGQIPKENLSIVEQFFGDNFEYLKDTEENNIVPMYAEALKNAEQNIETRDMNLSTIDDIMSYMGDFFDGVGDFTDGMKEDLLQEFENPRNPYQYIFDLMKEDLEEKRKALVEEALPVEEEVTNE